MPLKQFSGDSHSLSFLICRQIVWNPTRGNFAHAKPFRQNSMDAWLGHIQLLGQFCDSSHLNSRSISIKAQIFSMYMYVLINRRREWSTGTCSIVNLSVAVLHMLHQPLQCALRHCRLTNKLPPSPRPDEFQTASFLKVMNLTKTRCSSLDSHFHDQVTLVRQLKVWKFWDESFQKTTCDHFATLV